MSKDGIIFFEGGPNDGQTYFTKDLLGHKSLTIPITDYVWTSETKTSEKTGAVAQIWRYKGLVDAPAPAPAPVPMPAPVATPVSTVTEEPAVVVGPAEAVAAVSHVDSPAAEGVAGGDAPAAASEPVSGGSVATSVESMAGFPSGEELMQRRKAMKLSVGAVGDKAGLAHSKVASIENGTGKRIKPEEIRALVDAVVALEAERGGDAGAR